MDRVAVTASRFIRTAYDSSIRRRVVIRPERGAAGAKSKGISRSEAA
ncbi:hypothetical protein [Rhodanobacter sp. T12-5]|nr:hypothetical protein [Rhodanobacter sp. T12-5]